MHIAHHPIFVTLSIVIACLGSWTALDLFRRVRAHVGHLRGGWLLAAAIAMGLSIWAMHFIAMLGFSPGAEVRYDLRLTVLSLLLAIAATAFAFFFAAGQNLRRLMLGGLVMGTGICIMHYVGMAAVLTQPVLDNDPIYMAAAFLVAITASTGALVAARRERTWSQRALGAIVLGFAIVGMHYTAMFGVRLIAGTSGESGLGGIDTITLAFVVAFGTFFILFLALIAALSDRRFEALTAAEAQRSEHLLRAIVDHLPLGIFVAAAPSGEIRFANGEAEKLLGRPLGRDAIWVNDGHFGAIQPDGRPLAPHEHALYQAMNEKRRIGPRLQAYRRGDGTIAQLEVLAAPVPDRSGDGALAIVALQDVTAKLLAEEEARRTEALRASEAQLLRVNELLEERVAAALLQKAEAEAALIHAQRLESLGRLTGGVAHDFNNLLTVVIGALDIILRDPENAERRTRLGEAALAAAKRGERLTAQLLAFARRQPLRPEVCDLHSLIRESEPLLRRAVGEELLLNVQLNPSPALVLIDPAQFEATLLNLIVNAVDATKPGGRIFIETQLCDLPGAESSRLPRGRYLRLSVEDSGQGMSADVLDRIFEPFFTTKPPGKGTGLGLSQVYGFVRQSGGDVRVQSTQGHGSRFTLHLPVLDRPSVRLPAAENAQPTNSRALHVLLAEDEPAVASIMETMLRNLGHEVTTTANAEQALEVLQSEQQLDVLLSDVLMPGGMNGAELASRAVALRPDIKVLLSSGYAGEAVETAIAAGGWPFLKKPYAEAELAAQLEKLSIADDRVA